ncbi:MAG TPA: sporulation protein [Mycobacteriales bacterium]|jgi:sporulation-control protein|nr:sporulation protein [Mycobacteriales bacterium]
MVGDRPITTFGAGVEVDTILTDPVAMPGSALVGEIHFRGGKADYTVQSLNVEYLAIIDRDSGNPHAPLTIPFGRVEIARDVELRADTRQVVPFSIEVPWGTPINSVAGRRLRGVSLGIYTGMRMGGTFNKSDSDPLEVAPLPVQEQVLKALEHRRLVLGNTDLEDIRLPPAETSFLQKIKFALNEKLTHKFQELKVSFIADPKAVTVIMELDNGRANQLVVGHNQLSSVDLDTAIGGQLDAVIGN